jgi:hypothetical protein
MLIVFFIALIHFIYEGIVLPSIRVHLRNRLFRLRDELRNIRIEEPDQCPKEVFFYLDEGISLFLNKLPLMTMELWLKVDREYKKNPELKELSIKRRNMVEGCKSERVRRVYKNVYQVLEYAFLFNMGVWFFYLVPIALVVFSFSKIAESIIELLMMPRSESQKMLPHKTPA